MGYRRLLPAPQSWITFKEGSPSPHSGLTLGVLGTQALGNNRLWI